VEDLSVSSSRELNKSSTIRTILKNAATFLDEEDNVLIFTETPEEANSLRKFLKADSEIEKFIDSKKIHYAQPSLPTIGPQFTLVIYFSLPKKLEVLFSHMGILFNNYCYGKIGRVQKIPKMHFHLVTSPEDFIKERLALFKKKVTRLQINRMLKFLEGEYVKAIQKQGQSDNTTEATAIVSIKEISAVTDMDSAMIVRAIRYAQNEKLFFMANYVPKTYTIRVPNSGRDNADLKRILEISERTSGIYNVLCAYSAQS
jgi:hypothetical protein